MFVYKPVVNYSSDTVSFSGKILEFTEYSGDKTSYLVKGKINDDVTAKILVYADSYNCRVNDKFYFEGNLKTPENNYLFSQKDYYKSKGIYLISDKVSVLRITQNDNFSIVRILSDYKDYVTEFIVSCLPEDESAMLTGMLFGDKSRISDNDNELFYRTGIGHVMAVSGLHLVLFCGIFAFIFDKMKLGRISRFILLEIAMLLFAVCSGLSLSVMRAAFMMTLVYAAPVFFRYSDTLNSLFISLIILTVGCPFSVRNPSLILSLTGAFGAGVFAPYITDRMKNQNFCQRNIKKVTYMFCVSAVIFPVSVMCFGEGSFFSPLANIFLTPICMASLFLALIASLTVFLKPVILIKIAGLLCHIELKSVRWIGQQEFTYMNFDRNAKIILGILLIFCILTYFIFKNYKTEIVAVMASMVIFCTSVSVLNFVSRNDVKIALLGKDEIDVIVVSHKFSADIIDISGKKDNCRYVCKYLIDSNLS
ncbi:MAG: ComEC/Rec2 family competence protein, partial [Oscillospiraceae bacterium]|nr:ComEC/Rec2 family competence protein [Oscillospiraceae bacterium]